MKLTVIGCSPAWPNPGGAQSGYLVEGPGRLLLDCGPGVLGRLRRREPWPRVDAIALTHLHLDHWGDLVAWVVGVVYGPGAGAAPRPELWLPPRGRERLAAADVPAELDDVFAVSEYEPDVPFAAAGFTVTPVAGVHYGEQAFGLRVANGASSLAYSGDTAPGPHLAELARDVDLFLCEATLDEPEEGARGHLTADEALAAFGAAGARRLLLVHRPDELSLAPGLERARDGDELTV